MIGLAKKLIKGSRFEPVARSIRDLVTPKYTIIGRREHNYIKQIVSCVLTENSNCIDVGAHTGEVLRDFIRLAPCGKHMAFEPLPHLAADLRNNFSQVDVREVALSDTEGEATFYHNVSSPGYSGLKQRRYDKTPEKIEVVTVKTQKLDNLLSPDMKIDFIKIDVEGGEYNVLKGAIHTLKTHKPHVLFEFGSGAPEFYGVTPPMIYQLLVDECGLRMFALDGNGPLSLEQFVSLYEQECTSNFIAHA